MSEKEYPVQIDEAELANRLDPLSYEVLRNAATERPFTGEYTDTEVDALALHDRWSTGA